MPDWLAMTPDALDPAAAIAFVTASGSGGIAVFLGTTRAENSPQGHPLLRLDYEAYPEMATAQLKDLAARARRQWPIEKLALLHRTGPVPVGQPSVVIAVSTPHRGDAFAACRWLIDTLKSELAVWKKEAWSDGTGTWVHPEKP